MIRCEEQGWVPLSIPDGRRGIWMRVTKDKVELCSGREGDDNHVSFKLGEKVSERDIYEAGEVLSDFAFALETACNNISGALEARKVPGVQR